jgi:hypothetical protein
MYVGTRSTGAQEDHFLLELIQNSDDTKYSKAGSVPSLDITLTDSELSFRNNEVGRRG